MEIDFLPNEVAFWLQVRKTPPRSEGVHVSEVIMRMLKDVSKTYRSYGRGDRGDRDPVFEAGYLWEDVFAEIMQRRLQLGAHEELIPPLELAVDNIYGSPDRPVYDHDLGRLIVEETKFTWMSCIDVDQKCTDILMAKKFQYWLSQVKTYAAMLYTQYVPVVTTGRPANMKRALGLGNVVLRRVDDDNRCVGGIITLDGKPIQQQPPIARIRAFFVNGNYRGKIAIPIGWEIHWTGEELEQFWSMLRAYADDTMRPAQPEQEPIT